MRETTESGAAGGVTFAALSNAAADVVAAAGASVVTVNGRRRRPASGVVWSGDGLIVTANHVVERDDNLSVVTADGREHTAELVGRDPAIDVALLRIEHTGQTPARWSADGASRVGQLVLALARPNGSVEVSLGALSAVGGPWQHRSGGRFDHYLQVDVTMYPGFSGGGVVAPDGSFVGLSSSALARGVTLAIPAANVQRSANALRAHGRIPRAYLGVGVQRVQVQAGSIPDPHAHSALMIMSVEDDTPAAEAGILQGDILFELHGQALTSVEDLQNLLGELSTPTTAKARLLRGGSVQEYNVALTVR